MPRRRFGQLFSAVAAAVLVISTFGHADQTTILNDRPMHHLRIQGPREWAEFPEKPEGPRLDLSFQATKNVAPSTLRLRQQDVKQRWNVTLNDRQLGQLRINENDMVVYFSVPAGTLVQGSNTLRIEQPESEQPSVDDIRVGEIVIDSRPRVEILNESSLQIEVCDAENDQPLPARITIVNADGALQTTGATSGEHLAVRPGIAYTSTGKASVGLPAGRYRIYAGRGFEYSLDSIDVLLAPGTTFQAKLSIRREVPTRGYVACDPHVHTRTHSGHGDASVQERMITLAAEGIELPIATDHNVNIDHRPFARKQEVQQYFTPVIGNEVTTRVGHFNVFPIAPGAQAPNHRFNDWTSIFREIYRTPGVRVAILNHGRDLHAGTRPLGPKLHNAVVGENLRGWPPGMNAMEVINSAATQTDTLQLFHDWMSLLNRGRSITPIGSSDSHDVGRHFVGQGRTYVRCHDSDPGKIDVRSAVNSILEGRVLVSYGLLVDLTVNGKYRPGDLVRAYDDTLSVGVRVLGPDWVQGTRVRLFANGQPIRDQKITPKEDRDLPAGVKWEGQWTIAMPAHDVHLVAIATGPGIDAPYWKTAKPYKPTSPHWQPHVVACSGAVWVDADRDGRKTAAYDYARRLFAKADGHLPTLLTALSDFDQAVVAQVAHLYQSSGESWLSPHAQNELKKATGETQTAVRLYLDAWRANQRNR